jgi:hypothetical protein
MVAVLGDVMTTVRRTGWRRLTACLAIGALFCQAYLAALAIPASVALADIKGTFSAQNTIVICTGSGMKRITLGPDGEPVEQLDQDEALLSCHACALAGFFAFNTPAPPYFLSFASDTARLAARSFDIKAGGRSYICPESRAPPLSL